jgi:serine protease Do
MMTRIRISTLHILFVFVSLCMVLLSISPGAYAQSRTFPDFTDLVEQVGPSVVNIRTIERSLVRQNRGGTAPESMDEEIRELFRRFGLPVPNMPRGNQTPRNPAPDQDEQSGNTRRGVGSGFILTTNGYIMTNAHVVEGATEVIVTLTDKREFKAKMIGADKRTDVAVVKIEAIGLPAVRIGDGSRVKVGEWVMAIGSPFGLENTVTAGIVSAKQRDTGDYLPFIQTDVAINPGNSGGPLINMRGEVIGINSQIYSGNGGYQGISFAIPIDEAVRISDQLRSTGRVVRGRIGVQIGNVNRELAESIGLSKAHGAVVRSVERGLPAEKAGVEPGDIVLKFNGQTIEKSTDLPRLVGSVKPGTSVPLTVFRRGKSVELTVVVGELEPEKTTKTAGITEPKLPAVTANSLGLTVSELSNAQKSKLNLLGGVRIDSVTGAAARAGLKEDDVITAVLAPGVQEQVESLKDFDVVMKKINVSKPVTLLIRRGDWAQYIQIRPGK